MTRLTELACDLIDLAVEAGAVAAHEVALHAARAAQSHRVGGQSPRPCDVVLDYAHVLDEHMARLDGQREHWQEWCRLYRAYCDEEERHG